MDMTKEQFNSACEAYREMFRRMEGKSFKERRDMINDYRGGNYKQYLTKK